MKLRHFYVSVCLMLISILNIHAQTSVTLTEAGTLASKLPADLNTVSDLTISGPLNGTDILTIRAMAGNLKVLNLKEASIVEDKVNSYRGTGNNANYTQNNVIGDYMFYGMTALTKVVLPKNVWSIGTWSNDNPWNGENTQVEGSPKTSYASSADDTSYPGCASFARCVNLTVVGFPSTLLYIGPKAFSYCIKLPSIAIPEGVEAMGSYTFNQCKELTTASIPSTVGVGKKLTWYYIKDGGRYQNEPNYFGYTFKGCNKLSNVSLANNLKQLSPYMFQGCTALTQISLPNTLARLNGAFEQCSGLTALQFPEGLQNIGSLSGCSSLKTLTMPNGITELGSLSECTSLTSITLPNKINTIPNYVFQNCTSLASISIPNTVSEITYHAFDGCTSLSKITLSTELNSIGGYAFAGCSALTEITLPNKLITIGEYAFTGSALKNIKLPQSLTEIGQYAFRNCTQLVTINFPPNVTDIKSYTFQNCEKLANITLPSGLMTIQNYAFDGCKSLGKVTIPGGVQTISTGAFQNSGLTEVVLEYGVITLANNSFSGCNLLKKVTFPASMETIGGFSNTGIKNILFAADAKPKEISAGAFENCDSLETVTLPNSIITIGERAFYGCDTLQSVTLPTAIKIIPKELFSQCKNLKSIDIPEGVTEIQETAFYECKKLSSVKLPSTLASIGYGAFYNTAIISINIPEGVTTINNNTFSYCSSLKSVKLPKSLKQIIGANSWHDGAFYNCNALETVDFSGAALTEIGENTFRECNKLKSIDLSTTKLETIEANTFYGCNSLQNITFPTSLSSIGAQAFYNNYSLTAITFPANINSIANNAFNNCDKIRSVDFSATSLTTIDSWFSNTDSLRTVKLPETVTALKDNAFNNCPIEEINLPTGLSEIGNSSLNRARIKNLKITEKITNIGYGAFQYAHIKETLEITPAENLQLGDYAFNCQGSYTDNGQYINFHLVDVHWNSTSQFPKNKFGQIDNLYLLEGGSVNDKNNIGYIFYNGITDSIAIAYNNNYKYTVNKTMKTRKVTYTKKFNQQSGYGEAAGWKTIVLPFNVSEITHTRGYGQDQETVKLAPFGSSALETVGTLPFWLYELSADGKYKAATEIKAHQAYLICMPNNDKYPSDSNISGDVMFAATDKANGITLVPTEGVLKRSKGTKFDLVPTYDGVMQHDTVYVLNENNWYYSDEKNYPAGSVFIKNYSENYSSYPAVYPFQAYLATNEGKTSVASTPMLYSIGGSDGTITGIEDIPFATPEKATKAYSRDGVLYINTNADRTINIYDVTGRTVRIIEAREGMNEVHGLDSGIYLLEGQKVVIGR